MTLAQQEYDYTEKTRYEEKPKYERPRRERLAPVAGITRHNFAIIQLTSGKRIRVTADELRELHGLLGT